METLRDLGGFTSTLAYNGNGTENSYVSNDDQAWVALGFEYYRKVAINRLFLNAKWIYPLAFATLQACTCDRIVSEQIRSPDDQHQVVVFSDVCGYNVSLNTQVAVASSSRGSGWKGNAFIAFNGDPVGPYNAGGGPTVHARWVANDTIVLTYHKSAQVKVQNLNVDGIVIRYEVDSASVTRTDSAAAAW